MMWHKKLRKCWNFISSPKLSLEFYSPPHVQWTTLFWWWIVNLRLKVLGIGEKCNEEKLIQFFYFKTPLKCTLGSQWLPTDNSLRFSWSRQKPVNFSLHNSNDILHILFICLSCHLTLHALHEKFYDKGILKRKQRKKFKFCFLHIFFKRKKHQGTWKWKMAFRLYFFHEYRH